MSVAEDSTTSSGGAGALCSMAAGVMGDEHLGNETSGLPGLHCNRKSKEETRCSSEEQDDKCGGTVSWTSLPAFLLHGPP